MGNKRDAVLIAGPTASGKSTFAAALAQACNGVVINADSMQVYAELSILTARPTPDQLAQAPHRLYGHISIKDPYSVARWLADMKAELSAVQTAGQIPIITGGTGLYFKALLEGLSPIPEIPVEIRDHWRNWARKNEPSALYAELERRDVKTAASLRPTDTQRLVRALEVFEATRIPLTDWHQRKSPPLIDAEHAIRLVVERNRDDLYARCEKRFRKMIDEGALQEAREIQAMHLSPELPGMRALGLRPLLQHLDGNATLEDAITTAQQDTRRYIKRQSTWLRRYMITWIRTSTQEMQTEIDTQAAFLKS